MLKVFGWEHILYLIISFSIIIFALIFLKKKLNTEKKQIIFVKTVGILYLILLCINRYSCYYYWGPPNDGPESFMPHSFCSIISMFFCFMLIFCDKGAVSFHYITYLAFGAGMIPTFYPNYLANGLNFGFSTIFFMPTITSLICHSMMILMSLLMFVFGYEKTELKNFIYIIYGYGILTLYGVIYNFIYKTDIGFNIGTPVVGTIYSSTIFLILVPVFLIFLLIIDAIKYKNNSFFPKLFKKIFKKQH